MGINGRGGWEEIKEEEDGYVEGRQVKGAELQKSIHGEGMKPVNGMNGREHNKGNSHNSMWGTR